MNNLNNLAHHQGVVAGRRYGRSLREPANTRAAPACPYWRPCKRMYWMMGFQAGLFEAVYQD